MMVKMLSALFFFHIDVMSFLMVFLFKENGDGSDSDSDYEPDHMDTSSDFSMGDSSLGSIASSEVQMLEQDAALAVNSHISADPLILSKKNKRKWMEVHLSSIGSRTLLLERWCRVFQGFFYSGFPQNVRDKTF